MRRRRNPSAPMHIDHAAYQERCRSMSDAALRHTMKDAHAAERAMPDGYKAGYYADEVHYCAMELHRRKREAARRNPTRSNPKRDGTPTRGESRKVKFLDHLRKVRERGHAAQAELKRLTGKGRAVPSEPVLKAEKTETQLEHPGHYAPELSSDDKFIRAQIEEIDGTMADVRDRLKHLDSDSDDDADLAQELSTELVNLNKQKKELTAAMGKSVVVATNPGGRRRVHRRGKPLRGGQVTKRAYARALRRLCWHLSALAEMLPARRRARR